jgi:hypothetical protein
MLLDRQADVLACHREARVDVAPPGAERPLALGDAPLEQIDARPDAARITFAGAADRIELAEATP